MINEDKKSRGQEGKQLRVIARRIYGRTSETSPDSEQIEPSVVTATLAKFCERGVNPRQSVSDAAIHITEGQMSRCQEDKQKTNKPSPLVEQFKDRARVRSNYGLPRPHFVRPRNDETTCHSELVSESQKHEILQQVQHDMSIEGKKTRRQANYVNSLTSCLPDFWTSKKKAAFTLAEVLITLGIIGIVAAMTLPALITKHQQMVAVNKLKKSYSVLQNAVSAMIADNDTIPPSKMRFVYQLWDHPTYFNPDMFAEEFDKYLLHTESVAVDRFASSTFKMCANGNENHKGYTFSNGNNYNWANISHYWVLKDGTCVGLKTTGNWNWLESDNNGDWVVFYVDIDGSYRGFNRFGRDTFAFTFNPDGKIVPFGINIDSNDYFSCRRGAAGLYCTAKIFKDGWQIKKDYPW